MKPHYTLIEDLRCLSYQERSGFPCDILLRNAGEGRPSEIVAVEREIRRSSLPDCTLSVVKGKGCLVLPPFVDLAVILREPGSMYKEDIASTCRAALAGGYRELLTFFERDSRYSDAEVIRYIASSRSSPCVLCPTAPIAGADGDLSDRLGDCVKAGALAYTDYFSPLSGELAVREAMRLAAREGRLYHAFCLLPLLAGQGDVNAGVASLWGYRPIPASAEELAVMRNLLLAGETGCRLHLSGVSTRRSLSLIRQAKAEGLPVTCDLSPCHFFFNENDVIYHGTNAKLMPPLRSEADRQAAVKAIADGTVDAIASHHIPNGGERTKNRKMAEAPFGAVSLDLVFSACVERLLRPGEIDLFRLAELLTEGPGKILDSLTAGHSPLPRRIEVGARADFSLVSLNRAFTVDEDTLMGKAKNTPFLGTTLHGRVEKVFCDGVEQKIHK